MTVSADAAVLLDTNIIVYAHDRSAGEKHQVAMELIEKLAQAGTLNVSVQAINEFFSVIIRRKQAMGIELPQAAALASDFVALARVLPLTSATTLLALEVVVNDSISFWDALVWAVAFENHIQTVISEDFQAGRVLRGVQFVNPFQITGGA